MPPRRPNHQVASRFTSSRFTFLLLPSLLAATPPASQPLYRDPIHDGAADPALIHDPAHHRWLMFYTNRRANLPELKGVSWVHGTHIGIAQSTDNGNSWTYLTTADIQYGNQSFDTYWAPDVIADGKTFHMFVTFVPGQPKDWNEIRRIIHLTSTDLLHWTNPRELKLSSDRVIDPSLCKLPDNTWGLWYNNERDHKSIYLATSPDLENWTDHGKVQGIRDRGEGPKVFHWQNRYWMLVDHWKGLGAYSSQDARTWTSQPTLLLDTPGTGKDDGVIGNHCDVVPTPDRAFLFYFTHPGRTAPHAKDDTTEQRRSSIQVTELKYDPTTHSLSCNRNTPPTVSLPSN